MFLGYASEWIGEQVGGVERYAVNLLRHLLQVESEHRYAIFSTPRGARQLNDLSGPRVKLCPTRFNSRWFFVPIGLPLGLLRNQVDLLHATFTVVPWCPARRIILTVHDVGPSVHPEFYPPLIRARYYWLISRGTARADRVIVPSHAAKRELMDCFRVPEEKVAVIYEGVDSRFQGTSSPKITDGAVSMDWELPSEYILYVGRFHSRKNLERLIEAFGLMKRRRPSQLKMVLVGRDMWHRERVLKKIEDSGLGGEVICPGYVPDALLEMLYRKARAFAFPSIHEGFGIPPLEAMARGLPVMASSRSCLPEVLDGAALFPDPYSVEEMANALERLTDEEDLRSDLIERGKKLVQRYSWEEAARSTLKLYAEVLNKA